MIRRRSLLSVIASVCLCGCLAEVDFPDEEALALSLVETTLDFGDVEAQGLGRASIALQHTGVGAPITIDLRIEGTDEVRLAEPGPTVEVPAGESVAFLLDYRPTGESVLDAQLWFEPRTQQEPLGVRLMGRGFGALASLDPGPLDLGAVGVGCTSEALIPLRSVGRDDLRVFDVVLVDDTGEGEFSWGAGAEPPFTVLAGAEEVLRVRYSPTDASEDSATIRLTTNEWDRPEVETRLVGVGASAAPQEDVFQWPGRAVDLLVVVDDADIMEGAAVEFAPALADALEGVVQLGVSWQAGVLPMRHQPAALRDPNAPIHAGMADWEGELAAQVYPSGVAYRRGFSALEEWLSDSAPGPVLREGAGTLVVFFTNRDVAWEEGSPSEWWDAFQDLGLLHLADVTGGAEGCTPPQGIAAAGAEDIAAVVALAGGTSVSICEPGSPGSIALMTAALSDAAAVPPLTLSRPALAGTVEVWVDGVEQQTGWTWWEEFNEVRLGDPVPIGAEVVVRYVPRDCGPQ